MNNFYLLLLNFLLLISCNKKETITNDKASLENSSSLTSVNNLEGFWIRVDYINDLKLSKSPLKSFLFLKHISCLSIENKNEYKFLTKILFNNTEAIETFIEKKGTNFLLNLNWNGNEEKIKINRVSSNRISIELENREYIFFKIEEDSDVGNLEDGLHQITNTILFKNKSYSCFSLEKDSIISDNIHFNKDGNVMNFDLFKKYEVNLSFETNPNPLDLICFTDKLKETTCYHFIINQDNDVLFYDLEYDEEGEIINRKMIYKLELK